jgi:hypothetical protein
MAVRLAAYKTCMRWSFDSRRGKLGRRPYRKGFYRRRRRRVSRQSVGRMASPAPFGTNRDRIGIEAAGPSRSYSPIRSAAGRVVLRGSLNAELTARTYDLVKMEKPQPTAAATAASAARAAHRLQKICAVRNVFSRFVFSLSSSFSNHSRYGHRSRPRAAILFEMGAGPCKHRGVYYKEERFVGFGF